MGILKLMYKMVQRKVGRKKYTFNSISKRQFVRFNPRILDLGDIKRESNYIQALAAIFDLEGFTAFFNQPDPHLVVPEYMYLFLDWFFDEIAESFVFDENKYRIAIYGSFPFFAKFLGDGVLFLWNTDEWHGGKTGMGNIVLSLLQICKAYEDYFLPENGPKFTKPPSRLRVGIARGQVLTVGDGNDFVGQCINIASRLQKLSQLTYAISRRGLNLEECFGRTTRRDFLLKKVTLRGIGEDEVVIIDKLEYQNLPNDEKAFFR